MMLDGYEAPIELRAALTVSNAGIHVDYAGSSPASRFGINSPKCYTDAYTSFGVKCIVAPGIPNNAGSLEVVTVSATEDSIVHPLRPRATRFLNLRRVQTLTLRARDLITGSVLLALHAFDLRQQPASARFERGEILELTGEVGPPLLQAVANGLEVVSEKCGIEHAAIVPAIRWHAWSGRFEKSSFRRRVSGRDSSPRRR